MLKIILTTGHYIVAGYLDQPKNNQHRIKGAVYDRFHQLIEKNADCVIRAKHIVFTYTEGVKEDGAKDPTISSDRSEK